MGISPTMRRAVKRQKKSMERNKSRNSAMRTSIKNFRSSLEKDDIEQAKKKFIEAQKMIAKTSSKGTIRKKTASRKISRLNAALKKKSLQTSSSSENLSNSN